MAKWRQRLASWLMKGWRSGFDSDLAAVRQGRITEAEFSARLRGRSTRVGLRAGLAMAVAFGLLTIRDTTLLWPAMIMLLIGLGVFVTFLVRSMCMHRQRALVDVDARIKMCRIGHIADKDVLRHASRMAPVQGAYVAVGVMAFFAVLPLLEEGELETSEAVVDAIVGILAGINWTVVLWWLDRVSVRQALDQPTTREEAGEIRRRAAEAARQGSS